VNIEGLSRRFTTFRLTVESWISDGFNLWTSH
jgi:hypothetical protein